MDSISSDRKKNLDGQIGLFSLLEEEDSSSAIPIPSMPELSKTDMMNMEKETTGIYISGHPMDDYRGLLKGTHVVPISTLTDEEHPYEDDTIVSVAGIVQSVKMRTTRNNSMMANVVVEDDTASMEMLAFSKVLNEFGGYLQENSPVVVVGRLSIRDEKDPQIVINRVRPISDFEQELQPEPEKPAPAPAVPVGSTLYLKLPGEADPRYRKVRAVLNMFPGDWPVVVFFADNRTRRGTRAAIDDSRLFEELKNLLGEENVVLK
jgi:DNA polymerase-3 subunit alpha